jgi:hypothetical protein
MEAHLKSCPICREKYENFKHLHELFKKDTTIKRVYVERVLDEPSEERTYTEDEMREAKNRVWDKIEAKKRIKSRVWQRRLSVPIPFAAAAALVIALVTVLWLRGETILQNRFRQFDPVERFILSAEEESGIIPAADIKGVIQYLSSDGADIIILTLPESRSFSRMGEPAIIRAADYRRHP